MSEPEKQAETSERTKTEEELHKDLLRMIEEVSTLEEKRRDQREQAGQDIAGAKRPQPSPPVKSNLLQRTLNGYKAKADEKNRRDVRTVAHDLAAELLVVVLVVVFVSVGLLDANDLSKLGLTATGGTAVIAAVKTALDKYKKLGEQNGKDDDFYDQMSQRIQYLEFITDKEAYAAEAYLIAVQLYIWCRELYPGNLKDPCCLYLPNSEILRLEKHLYRT